MHERVHEHVQILYDEAMIGHTNGPGHPERPERLSAIVDELSRHPLADLTWSPPPLATREQIERIHTVDHVDRIDSVRGRTARLDIDTAVCPMSVDAAYLAAGAAVAAVESITNGSVRRAFALVRPPGHHAEPDRAMGFCLFNNVAIAAAHARAALGYRRVLIVDWDVHHGNGTQSAFYDRDDVLFFGSHRYPFFYPGTGGVDEIGSGPGQGYTVNVPLPVGADDELVVGLYQALLPPIAEAFAPDIVLVSAGFDAHQDDPLGGLQMTDNGFGQLCGLVRDVAERWAEGRVALLLEGGYDLGALSRGARTCLAILAGDDPPPAQAGPRVADFIDSMRRRHEATWPVLAR